MVAGLGASVAGLGASVAGLGALVAGLGASVAGLGAAVAGLGASVAVSVGHGAVTTPGAGAPGTIVAVNVQQRMKCFYMYLILILESK